MGSEMDNCGPCQFRNEDKKATKYCLTCEESQCSTCADIHASSKATRKHLLLAITDLKTVSKTTEDLEKFQNCNDHTEKKLEFFCLDHEHYLCSICLLNIRELKCKTIVDIEIAGEQLLTTKFNERMSKDLENIGKHCRDQENEIARMIEKSLLNKQEIQKYMTDLKYKVINQLEKCEKDILDKVNTTEEKRNSELKSQQNVLKETRQTASENKDILQKIVSNYTSADIFRCSFSLVEQTEKLPLYKLPMTTEMCCYSVDLSPIMHSSTKSTDNHLLMQCKTTTTLNTLQICLSVTADKERFLQTTKQIALTEDRKLSFDYGCSSVGADVNCSCSSSKSISENDSMVQTKAGANNIVEDNASLNEALNDEKHPFFVRISDNVLTIPDGKQPEITDIVTLTDGCIVLSDSK
ncbi:E3 ubiquitin-protein ligase TRIM33-like, partial [Ruditapes philippinarum]|uniref:E3 ubiquitin-protein ligase TRIM33-like n=1 Tax=Ruditapes philippinarum TaxID=129788 RepID=UPI00295A7CB7